MTSLTFKIVLGLYALLLVLGVGSANAELSDSYKMALYAIQEAESAGADVSALLSQFNVAMDLLQQAEQSDFDSCMSHDACIEAANGIFESIENDAHNLGEVAKRSLYEKMLISEAYAIAIAFGMSLGLLYIYKHYKSYQLRRFLEMDITGSS